MSSPYVWLKITAEGMPTSDSIVFIGKPEQCVEWVKRADWKRDIMPVIRYELRNGFWFRFRNGVLNCTLVAGENETRIERKLKVNVK